MAGRVTVDPPGLAARIATAVALLLASLLGPISGPFTYGVIGISVLVIATGLGTQSTGQGRFPRGFVIVLGLVFVLMLRTGVASSFLVVPCIVAAGVFAQISHERGTVGRDRILKASSVAVVAMLIAAVLAGLNYSSGNGGGRPDSGGVESTPQDQRAGKDNAISRFFDDAVRVVKQFFGLEDGDVATGEGEDAPPLGRPQPPDEGPNWWRILLVAFVAVVLVAVILLLIRSWRRRRGSGDVMGPNWAVARLDRVGATAARDRAAGEGPLTYGVAVDRAVDDTRVGRAGALISEAIYDPATRDFEHEDAVRSALDDLEATPPPSVRTRRRVIRVPRRWRGR